MVLAQDVPSSPPLALLVLQVWAALVGLQAQMPQVELALGVAVQVPLVVALSRGSST